MSQAVGIDAILGLQGATRSARAYAFLNAAFTRTATGPSPVRDALDCLLPFVTPYTSKIAGSQIDLSKLQQFLASTYGFDIPLYALDSLMPALRQGGYAEYRKQHRIFIATAKESEFRVAKEEIETHFDEVSRLLSRHANALGFGTSPPSGSWEDALIQFLKPGNPATERKIVNLKNVLVDARDAERRVVASFLSRLSDDQPQRFQSVVNIFMGVLVEDFLSSITEIGIVDRSNPLKIFYDTTVLLRALGCSGKLFKTATDELTRYLQDLGCEIRFLAGNEAEVDNVLSTILTVKDSGGELEGETADAVSKGEVTIPQLRMLQNNFVEQLAAQNIFEEAIPAHSAHELQQHQINEVGFAAYLKEQAISRGHNYGEQNRKNDAGYLGTVMRLRKGQRTRDLAASSYLFVTTNRLLASASRSYLIREKQLTHLQCPPILHVSQVATIAWLLKDQKLKPERAGRELLTNCYAAIRPDAEWFKSFREGFEMVVGDLDSFAHNSENSFILQAARRIAQEESFSNSNIMRELNAAEIIDRSRRLIETREQELHLAHATAVSEASKAARDEARAEAAADLDQDITRWAQRRAKNIVLAAKCVLLVLLVCVLIADALVVPGSGIFLVVKSALGIVVVLGVLDMFNFKIVSKWFDLLRTGIASREVGRLRSGLRASAPDR